MDSNGMIKCAGASTALENRPLGETIVCTTCIWTTSTFINAEWGCSQGTAVRRVRQAASIETILQKIYVYWFFSLSLSRSTLRWWDDFEGDCEWEPFVWKIFQNFLRTHTIDKCFRWLNATPKWNPFVPSCTGDTVSRFGQIKRNWELITSDAVSSGLESIFFRSRIHSKKPNVIEL